MSDSPAAILHNSAGTEVATPSNPLRVDPTGTTTQPVSDGGGSITVDGSVAVTNFPAVQPVSDNGGSITVDGTVAVSGTVPVSGPLTDTQLRATPVPVSGTVTANAGTGPWPVTDNGGSLTVDAASLPLPTGAATAALQTQPGVDIGDVTVNNGAGVAAVNIQDGGNSITVDGTVAVSNFPATQPISAASLPLPTGASTSALQTTGNTSLSNIDGKLPAALVGGRLDENVGAWLGSTAPTVGQKAMASSVPVVMASNQSAIPVTQAGSSEITFTVMSLNTTLSNNKSLLSIFNPVGSGVKIKLREFYIRNPQTSAVTGVAGDFRIYRFAKATAPTGGTTVNPVKHDSSDSIVAGLDCRSGATAIGTEEADPLDRIIQSTDDWGPGTLDQEGAQQNIANYLPARAKRDAQIKAFTCNPGEGLHMKFATNSTAGTQDIIFVCTQE